VLPVASAWFVAIAVLTTAFSRSVCFAESFDITHGRMLLGHTRGGPELLAGCCEELLAISAPCTHYGGRSPRGCCSDDRS
jgi:hypothetical protein